MSDPEPVPPEATDIQLARHVDAICRKFEASWRAGGRPAIGDYLGEVAEEGQGVLRAELEALESELRQADEAATVAPASSPTSPIPGEASSLVHEEVTLPPRDQATGDFGPSRPKPMRPRRTASATSVITSCCARSRAAAWGWCTGRGRSA